MIKSVLWGTVGVCGVITTADKFYKNIITMYTSVPKLKKEIKELFS